MRRKKTLIILCIILAVAIVAIVIEHAVKQHVDKINTVDEEVFAITNDEVTNLSVEYGSDSVTLEKTDDVWHYTEDADFPVDQDKVADLFSNFESVHASFIIDDVTDYAQYGLGAPQATVTFTTADGDRVVTFGDYSTIDQKRYICVDGGSVYLIDTDFLEDLSGAVGDYLDSDEVYDYQQLTNLTMSGDASVNVEYDPDGDYTYTDAYDYYSVDGDSHKALSSSKIDTLLTTLQSMDLSKYETYKATSDDVAKYGLDNPNITVKITGEVAKDSDEDSDDEDVETETKNQTLYLTKKDDDHAYAYFEGSTIIYDLKPEMYDEIAKASYESLRPDEIVNIDWTAVDNIAVNIGEDSYIIDVDTDKKDGNTYTIDGEKVDLTAASSEINNLSLTDAGSDYSKGAQEMSFTITLTDDDATQVKVVLSQYDGNSCVATVDGETVGLVSRTSMSTLREDITSAILNKGKDTDKDSDENATN
ncbi:MAG: DUF4340 domain-containing protein [Pseudobutyrivibrio sp.]|nr:DUF4340 domain-containing protein [Pseudobutyrivibrio sp.]